MRKKLTSREIKDFCEKMEPYDPKKEIRKTIKEKIKNLPKDCHTCQDYIVCWGMEEVGDRNKENCPDWQLDFMILQRLLDEKNNSTTNGQKQENPASSEQDHTG